MMTEYNKLVDHLVSTMPSNSSPMTNNERQPFITQKVTTKERKSFDELYEEYSSLSLEDQVENLKQLGRQLVTTIDRLLDTLNVLIDEKETDNS